MAGGFFRTTVPSDVREHAASGNSPQQAKTVMAVQRNPIIRPTYPNVIQWLAAYHGLRGFFAAGLRKSRGFRRTGRPGREK
jgi:hypothetical protein